MNRIDFPSPLGYQQGMEKRLTDLEHKITNQDDLLDQLNKIIYQQQVKIDQLERAVKELEKSASFDIGPHNVKPPHY